MVPDTCPLGLRGEENVVECTYPLHAERKIRRCGRHVRDVEPFRICSVHVEFEDARKTFPALLTLGDLGCRWSHWLIASRSMRYAWCFRVVRCPWSRRQAAVARRGGARPTKRRALYPEHAAGDQFLVACQREVLRMISHFGVLRKTFRGAGEYRPRSRGTKAKRREQEGGNQAPRCLGSVSPERLEIGSSFKEDYPELGGATLGPLYCF